MCFIAPNIHANESSVINHEPKEQLNVTKAETCSIFDAFDLDNTGFLTAAKIRHVLTAADIHVNDRTTTELVTMCDRNGDGRVSVTEFEYLLQVLGYKVIESNGLGNMSSTSENIEKNNCNTVCTENSLISVAEVPITLQKVMSALDPSNTGFVSRETLQGVCESLGALIMPDADIESESNHSHTVGHSSSATHPHSDRGLGPLLGRVNHVALIVSDVGRSAWFYAQVLGLAQIRRPDFDEHGAWFTAGNVELHLIKGRPAVPGPDDLIVGHVSIEARDADDIHAISGRLKELSYPFRQNVSVPNSADTGELGTNTANDSDKVVKQFFVRDPDGYYIEVCNCDVLTGYCLGEGTGEEYEPNFAEERYSGVLRRWVASANQRLTHRLASVKQLGDKGGDIEELSKIVGVRNAAGEFVDEEMMGRFGARTSVYGDLCQNESLESLRTILMRCGNDAIKANEIISMRVEHHGRQVYQPPAFYEQDTDFTVPPCFEMTVNRTAVVHCKCS